MSRYALAVALAGTLVPGAPLRAQTSFVDPVDLQSRFEMQVNLDLPRRWEMSLGYELRLTDNVSSYHGSYFTGELRRSVGSHLSVFGNYRLARLTDEVAHRFGIGAELKTKRGRVNLSLRPLFQFQHKVLDDAEQDVQQVLRTRLKASLKAARHVEVYGSVEPYFAFSALYPIDNWRNTAGVQWEFRKDLTLDLYYIYRPDYGRFYNRTFHILGVEMSIDLAP
jgi:uncharacterized protein DUF2490